MFLQISRFGDYVTSLIVSVNSVTNNCYAVHIDLRRYYHQEPCVYEGIAPRRTENIVRRNCTPLRRESAMKESRPITLRIYQEGITPGAQLG